MPARRVVHPPELERAYRRMRRSLEGVVTIGVTGTKGKTSTCEFIGQLLDAAGQRAAVSTTESARVGSRYVQACETARDMRDFVVRAGRSGARALVMELASTVLAIDFHHGLDLDVAVLTNIGTDHFRFHGGPRQYVAAKMRMFRDLRATTSNPRPAAIVNGDDPRARAFLEVLPREASAWLYGLERPRLRRLASHALWASDIVDAGDGVSFLVHGVPGAPLPCRTALRGAFNAPNVLAAIASLVALGHEARDVVAHAARLVAPPGRFDIVVPPSARVPGVVVDFAHTPESVDAALRAGRALAPSGRVHAVFGAGGDCYKGKRPLMGAAALRARGTRPRVGDTRRGPRGSTR